METKGRIIKAGPLEERQRKADGSTYKMFEMHIQIGTYEREIADYSTHQFTTKTEADTISKSYFGSDAEAASTMYHVGDVVQVRYHHFVDQYGRANAVVDAMQHVNVEQQAQQPAVPQAQATAPVGGDAFKQDNGVLPF